MTATLTQLRDALATQIAAQIPGLRASETVPSAIVTPVAIVGPSAGVFADYEVTMAPDAAVVNWTLRVYLIVSRANDVSGQYALDAYLASTGDQSVSAAVQFDPTLGGVCDCATAVRAQRYGMVAYNGVDYLGAEILVEVY